MKDYVQRHYHALKKTEKVWLRKSAGISLVIGGVLGFLPVLGYWMFPLGLALLSVDSPKARRLYRRIYVWWGRQAQRVRVWLRQPAPTRAARGRRTAGSHGTHSGP
jgi:hypothetical protein